jgi:hypothetical protein
MVESVRSAMETDGALYQISSNFYIQTVIGAGSVVGHDQGWTLDNLKAVLAESPEGTSIFMPYFTRDSILQYSLQSGMDEFVDWQTGSAALKATALRTFSSSPTLSQRNSTGKRTGILPTANIKCL